jgi:hypothetical protein
MYLSDLPESDVSAFVYTKASNSLVRRTPTPHGIFLHPPSRGFSHVVYGIPSGFRRFRTGVAIQDGTNGGLGSGSPLTFEVWGDGHLLWQSGSVQRCGDVRECDIDVNGKTSLELRVVCRGDAYCAHAVWVGPRLVK